MKSRMRGIIECDKCCENSKLYLSLEKHEIIKMLTRTTESTDIVGADTGNGMEKIKKVRRVKKKKRNERPKKKTLQASDRMLCMGWWSVAVR